MLMTTNTKVKTQKIPAAPKKKRKKRTKRMYFTQVHQDAIVEYVATDSVERRTELYVLLFLISTPFATNARSGL